MTGSDEFRDGRLLVGKGKVGEVESGAYRAAHQGIDAG
jgi:hypothetical protein